ncbi:MAG: CHAT domain-containing protein [Pseudanabaenaceae cyanobacterium SKYGB_i_bin29]|nr:CHAT domain-containing protein [Pseudanabaenaceae cyanobacterium SKYG29]MDW8421656.1 CHAT domain-containing protein [Pseudanabaenaceae cyanobacterium SKYGB_i_bin29]
MLQQWVGTVVFCLCVVSLSLSASELARKAYEEGNYKLAVALWQDSLRKFERQGDIANQAMALSNISLAWQKLGEWEKATTTIDRSLSLLSSGVIENKLLLAQALDIHGQLWQERGKPAQAIASWQKAAKLYADLGQTERLIQNQLNQAIALRSLGLYSRSCSIILQTLGWRGQECQITQQDIDNLNKNNQINPQQLSTALRQLADTLRVVGKLTQAEQLLQLSLNYVTTTQEKQRVYLSLGDTYRTLAIRQTNTANTDLQRHYRELAHKHYLLSGNTLASKLGLLRLAIDRSEAIDSLVPSIEADLQTSSPSQLTVFTRLELAQHLLCQSHPALSELAKLQASPIMQSCRPNFSSEKEIPWMKIIDLLQTAIAEAQTLENKRAESYAVGYLAGVYHQQGKLQQAETLTLQALALAATAGASDITYLWQWQLGRISRAQQRTADSLSFYAAAFQTLQPLRRDLVAINPEIQFTFRDSIEPIYREYVDLLLADRNPSQSNLQQARNVIEALQLAELDDFFREACINVKPKVIDAIDPRAAVFYPVIGYRRLDVIVKLPGDQNLLHYAIPVEKTSVESTLKALQTYLPDRTRSAQVRQLSQTVYSWLIRPVQDRLAAIQAQQNEPINLVFVLDGILRNVPMAALYDGKAYLIQKYPVAVAPSLQLVDPQPLAKVEIAALVAGISQERAVQGRSFVALPQVESELVSVQGKVKTKDKLLNPNFTSFNLQERLATKDVSIVHIATHGKFSSIAEETFVLLWDQLLNVKEFDQILRATERGKPIELLVLSACETAAGDNRAALGLAGVAIRAGARSTLATLWPVDDVFTAFFMERFYTELSKPGVTKALALRKAQLAALQVENRPYFWAPYILIGNWL